MGFLDKVRAKSMGLPPRVYDLIKRLQPIFDSHSMFEGHPDAAMQMLGGFAGEHGHDMIDELAASEVDDFIVLLEGIDHLTHPDNMELYNKYGCEACRTVYHALWRLATEPLLEAMKSADYKPPSLDDLSPEEQRAMIERLGESQDFLEGNREWRS